MTDSKSLMSGSYKVIFILSIGMAFLSLLGGSKGGLGTLLWGYTAWLMYSRNNKSLATLFKVLFWFEVVVGGLGLIIIATNQTNNLIDYSLFAYTALIAIAGLISFGLMKYFQAQQKDGVSNESLYTKSSSVKSDNHSMGFSLYPIAISGILAILVGVIFYFFGDISTKVNSYIAPQSSSKPSVDVPVTSTNSADLDAMILKFYRVNKNTDLIGNKRITYRDLTDDELRDIVTYYNTEKDFKNLKAGTTNLDALTIQQLINLQAYYKVNRIP